MDIDFTKLHIFYYLTILKNINQVVSKLDVSASKIKFSIDQLEKKHNIKLFQRDGKVKITTYRLTSAGTTLFERISPFFSTFIYEKEEDLFNGFMVGAEKIIIKSTSGIIKFILLPALLMLKEEVFSNLAIKKLTSNEFVSDLIGDKDSKNVITVTSQKLDNSSFLFDRLTTIRFSLLAEKSLLARNNIDSFDNIGETPLYFFSEKELMRVGKKHFKDCNINFIEDFDLLISILEEGKGIVLLPNCYAQMSNSEIINPFKNLFYEEDIYMSYTKTELNNPIGREIIECLMANT